VADKPGCRNYHLSLRATDSGAGTGVINGRNLFPGKDFPPLKKGESGGFEQSASLPPFLKGGARGI
jgi:hypothetical protein